jgi:hypothetical protein
VISWEEYIKSNISKFRKHYEKLPEERRKLIEENKKSFIFSLCKPTQVVVFDFNKPNLKWFIVLHNEKVPDKETIVFRVLDFKDLFSKVLKHPRLLDLLGTKEIQRITQWIKTKTSEEGKDEGWESKGFEKSFWVTFNADPRSFPNQSIFSDFSDIYMSVELDLSLGEKHRRQIEDAVDDIKRDVEKIPEIAIKTRIMEKTERLEAQMMQLDKKLKEEISGIRKIIGIAKEFQDWRTLVSDVYRLKGEHVPREVFESRLKELIAKIETFEKIEKAYERLSTQQEKVLEQQSSFLKWIKYSVILVPIAVACIPIVELLIRHFLGIS